MGEGADMGAAGADMGGGGADMGAAGGEGGAAGMMGGGGGEAETPIPGSQPETSGAETTGQGGQGGGMLSFAVSDNMAGMAGSNTMGIQAPSSNVSGSSTAPANAGAQEGTGDIERKNPFGGEAGTTQKSPDAKKEPTAAEKMGQIMKDFGKKTQEDSAGGSSPIPSPSPGGNSYSTLFGSPVSMGGRGPAPMQMPAMPSAGQVAPMAAPPPPPMAAGGGLPPPMQIQPPSAPAVPQIQLGATSDIRAKKNVAWANKDVERILQKVYDNVTTKSKGKK